MPIEAEMSPIRRRRRRHSIAFWRRLLITHKAVWPAAIQMYRYVTCAFNVRSHPIFWMIPTPSWPTPIGPPGPVIHAVAAITIPRPPVFRPEPSPCQERSARGITPAVWACWFCGHGAAAYAFGTIVQIFIPISIRTPPTPRPRPIRPGLITARVWEILVVVERNRSPDSAPLSQV